jgi:outer membrane protein assembly factor BamB
MLRPCAWCVVLVSCAAVLSAAEFKPQPFDWPQWQGPARTTISRETGLLKSWPKEGPPLAWKASGLGGGYCTPSIAAGRILGMSYRGDDEVVWALDETNGKELWVTRVAAANRKVGYGEGSRCTPTVDGEVLYALGVSGDLVCLNVADGKLLWQRSLVKDFGGNIPGWGYSESPLVDGDRVIATPGGKKATLVALNKKTGETIWQAQVPQGDGAHYASAIRAEVNGQAQYIQFLRGGLVGISATDGTFLWRYNKPANGTANCSTAIVHDNRVFGASAYGTGGGLVRLTPEGSMVKAEEVYFTKDMKNHHGGMVLLDGYLYGSNEGELVCLEFKTGEVKWRERKPGKGSISYADGHLYYRNEGGPVVLVEATPNDYVECGRFNQPERSKKRAWAHPVVANGKLYLLDQDTLFCYDVKQR